MDTATLKQILVEEMRLYAGEGLNAFSYLTISEDTELYAVIDIAMVRGKQLVGAVLVARVVDDRIYIELDQNDRLLVDALKARGIPETQLLLNYLAQYADTHPLPDSWVAN